MKTLMFLGILAMSVSLSQAQSLKSDFDNIAAENKVLTHKIDSFFNSARSEIQSRIKHTDRLSRGAKKAKDVLPLYQADCDYFTSTLKKVESFKKSLKDQNEINNQASKDLRADKSSTESEKNNLGKILYQLSVDNDNNKGKLKDVRKNSKRLAKKSCKRAKKLKKIADKE